MPATAGVKAKESSCKAKHFGPRKRKRRKQMPGNFLCSFFAFSFFNWWEGNVRTRKRLPFGGESQWVGAVEDGGSPLCESYKPRE